MTDPRERLLAGSDTPRSEGASDGSRGFLRTLEAGTVLEGRYEVLRVLGLGGMSTVYLSCDRRFTGVDKLCAIKEMSEPDVDPEAKRLRLSIFQREANILASLNHPSIPKVYDFFSEGGKTYLVIEYVEGRDLETILEESPECMSEADVTNWAMQICNVMTYLHNRKPDPIIFRDLKPSNIMLSDLGHIVLIDFGIAKVFESSKKGTIVGTEGFAPPEQYRGIASPQGDIYALGATMHYLLTRSDPRFETPFTFHERPLRKLNPGISGSVEAVISRALEYDMSKRFATAQEMKRALLEARSAASSAQPHSSAPAEQSGSTSVAETPRLLWEFGCLDEIRSTPLIHAGAIYFGSYDKTFYALDLKTGELKWSFMAQAGICSSSCRLGDSIIFGSEEGCIYSVNALTGRQLWSFRTGGPIRSSPRAAGEMVYVGSDDKYLYAIEGRTGKLVWRHATWKPVRSSPYVAEGAVFVGSDDEYVYAVDASSGISRWKSHTLGPVVASPVVAERLVLIGSTDRNIYALDASTGFPVWRVATEGKITSSPVVSGSHLLIGSADNGLYCLDLKAGEIVWRFATEGPITSSPKVHRDTAYVGSVDGHLYSVEMSTGRLRWRFKTKGPVPGSAAFGDGTVFIGSLDSKLYALSA